MRGRPRARCTPVLLVLAIALVSVAGCASWRAAGLYQRGTQALERGDSLQAVGLFEEAARLVPEASEVQNHLGLAQLAAGQDDLALESFERATQLDCDNAAARDNLARLQGHLLREAAIASVSSPRAAEPRDPEGRVAASQGEAP
jgi:Flp pilus assembly protein TadD